MTGIKFCGMTRPEDAALAARLGATHVGVIFAESSRRISPAAANDVFAAAGDLARVGVFGHMEVDEVLAVAREASLDVLQLHTGYVPEERAGLRKDFAGALWQVVPVDASSGNVGAEWSQLAETVDALLLDTRVRGSSGGTGKTFDWRAAAAQLRAVSARTPIVLAGGLTPSNVGEAIGILGPAIVDVSSGVELAPGIKDPALMRAFAQAVRSASIV